MKSLTTICIILFPMVLPLISNAQTTAYASIFAEIVSPVGIEKSGDLTFSMNTSTQNSIPNALNSLQLIESPGSAANITQMAASFKITGGMRSTIDILLPSESYSIETEGASSLVVSKFFNESVEDRSIINDTQTLKIGAILQISEELQTGNYCIQSRFPVTLNYN